MPWRIGLACHTLLAVCAGSDLGTSEAGKFIPQLVIEPTVDPGGIITLAQTVAGTPPAAGSANSGSLNTPNSVAVASDGRLYIAEGRNHVIRTIKVDAGLGSALKVLAGDGKAGWEDGGGEAARFFNPTAIVLDEASATLFVADTSNHAIRRVSTDGMCDTLFKGRSYMQAEARADVTAPQGLWNPQGIALWTDAAGQMHIFVADSDNHRLVALSRSALGVWTLSHVAGTGSSGLADGAAAAAAFRFPRGIAMCADEGGSPLLVVADSGNHVIRRVHSGGGAAGFVYTEGQGWTALAVDTLAGDGEPGFVDSRTKQVKPKASVLRTTRLPASFALPYDVACGEDGAVLVADSANNRVRHVTADGLVITVAGSSEARWADGLGVTQARFSSPHGVSLDARGRIYVADSANHAIRRVIIDTLADESLSSAAYSNGLAAGPAWLLPSAFVAMLLGLAGRRLRPQALRRHS